MASGSDVGARRGGHDPAWKYATPVDGNKNATICSFCGLILQSGGITRFKYHLSHTDPAKNARPCEKVPPEVKNEIRTLIRCKEVAKGKKAARMEDIRTELRQGLSQGFDDDEDDDIECPQDVDPAERHAYRAAIRQSRASEWERQQMHHFGSSKRGSPSRQKSAPSSQFRRTQSGRGVNFDPTPAPSLYKSSDSKQKRIKSMFSSGNLKETLGRMVSKLFIYENLPPQKASSHHFKNMIACAQDVGKGVPTPTPYEIKHKYLDMEYAEMQEYVITQKEKWKTYGCTIMADGWTGPTKLSIINFMVYCKGTTAFLKSVDASNKIKDHTYIYDLLKAVVHEVGKKNVVQIVTDNGSAYVKAGRKMQQKYNLYWTPCAAHCIDLIFEEIGKRESIKTIIAKARQVTNFIYNHGWLLAKMREVCSGDIVRPGATRFATNYIALDSLYKKKSNLKQLFTGDEWGENRLSRTNIGRVVESQVLDNTFWDGVQHIVGIFEPLYQVLRVVDTEVVPTMPILYDLIQTMKEKVQTVRYSQWIQKIIDSRWDRTLSHPLHAAAYYLNPRFQYRSGVGEDANLIQAVHHVFNKLLPDSNGVAQFGNELIYFRDARRGFGDRTAIAARNTMPASDWWVMYGGSAPTVRQLAIRILAQTASSSACERNWSTFALIHTKQRNRLAYPKLEKLVFCYYNMKLRIRDMEAEADRVAEQEYLDLVDISAETDNEEGDQLYQWIRPAHLDDDEGNPDPQVAAVARECGIDVDQVLHEEVGRTPSGSESHVSSSSDDGGGNDSGSNIGGLRDTNEDDYSNQGNLSPFTVERDYTHATQDSDHGCRAGGPGIGAIGKDYTRRRGRNQGWSSSTDEASLPSNLDSMSISTDRSDAFSDILPHNMVRRSHEHEWIDQGLFDYSFHQVPHEGQQFSQQYDFWVNPNFPIYGVTVGRNAETYAWHLQDYHQNYSNVINWYQYCLDKDGASVPFEPHRSSFWY